MADQRTPAWEDAPTNSGREIPIVRSRNQAHRDQRLLAILDKIAELDELGQSEMLGYTLGLLDGMAAKRTPAA